LTETGECPPELENKKISNKTPCMQQNVRGNASLKILANYFRSMFNIRRRKRIRNVIVRQKQHLK